MMPRLRLPLLLLPAVPILTPRPAWAQPPSAPSTVAKPGAMVFNAPAPPPDPAPITQAELQNLFGGPTLVTLSGRDLVVDEVVNTLLQGAKVERAEIGMNARRTVNIDWNQTPFWTAAAELEKQTGQTWDARFGSGLSLMQFGQRPGSGLSGARAAQTPYVLIVANSIERNSSRTAALGVPAAPPTSSESASLSLTFYYDPKLRVQSSTLRDLKFQQGNAAPIETPRNPFGSEFPGRTLLISQQNVPLPDPAPAGTAFSRISGVLHTVIAASSQVFKVPDLGATPDAAGNVGPFALAVRGVTVEEGELTVRLGAKADAAAERGNALQTVYAGLRVLDGAGQPVPSGGYSYGGERGEFRFSLRDRKGETRTGPFSLEWTVTTATRSLDIPFALRDVVVP